MSIFRRRLPQLSEGISQNGLQNVTELLLQLHNYS